MKAFSFKSKSNPFIKCFKNCGCSRSGLCNYCNENYFIGYDLYNSNKYPNYVPISLSLISPNTTGLTCTRNDVQIQVNFFLLNRYINTDLHL